MEQRHQQHNAHASRPKRGKDHKLFLKLKYKYSEDKAAHSMVNSWHHEQGKPTHNSYKH